MTTEFLVKLKPGVDPTAMARRIDERFRTDQAQTDTKTQQAFVMAAVGEVAGLVDFARILGWIAVGVVVLILGNTVFISAQTRSQELGDARDDRACRRRRSRSRSWRRACCSR